MFDLTSEALRARDSLKWRDPDPAELPAWVADMDVEVPAAVAAAIQRMVATSSLGYPDFDAPDPLAAAFEHRMATRYGWTPAAGRTRSFTDVIQILQVALEFLTAPGDAVAIHVPAYPIFLRSIADVGRRVVPIDEAADGAQLAARWRSDGVRLVVVVNPHNPSGRMLGADTLGVLAGAAADLDLPVLSDEIHADLAFDGRRHVPFASLGADVEARTITATSPSKAFNLAGLHCAVAHLGHAAFAARVAAVPFAFLGGVSTLSRAAAVAAWTEADPWLDEVVGTLTANRDAVTRWAAEVGVQVAPAQASYLAWLDFSGTSVAADPAGLILAGARVRLSAGPEFTEHTAIDSSGFARLNFGTSPALLDQILGRITAVLR